MTDILPARRPDTAPLALLDHDTRVRHHKLCLDLCIVCALMMLSALLAANDVSPVMAGCGAQIPLAIQALISHRYRL